MEIVLSGIGMAAGLLFGLIQDLFTRGLPRPAPVRSAGALGSSVFLQAGPRGVTRIDEFDASRDELVVLYDATLHPRPALTVRRRPGTREAEVLLDGRPLAVLPRAARITAARIRLVREGD